ncbi:hypothetical protein [Streptomyces sp. NPDC059215]|uniref:hypothetical protein n=1 Tax=Streptomyces sp. NPDC059215 TaxID=3346772 RepID=UPI00369DBAA7
MDVNDAVAEWMTKILQELGDPSSLHDYGEELKTQATHYQTLHEQLTQASKNMSWESPNAEMYSQVLDNHAALISDTATTLETTGNQTQEHAEKAWLIVKQVIGIILEIAEILAVGMALSWLGGIVLDWMWARLLPLMRSVLDLLTKFRTLVTEFSEFLRSVGSTLGRTGERIGAGLGKFTESLVIEHLPAQARAYPGFYVAMAAPKLLSGRPVDWKANAWQLAVFFGFDTGLGMAEDILERTAFGAGLKRLVTGDKTLTADEASTTETGATGVRSTEPVVSELSAATRRPDRESVAEGEPSTPAPATDAAPTARARTQSAPSISLSARNDVTEQATPLGIRTEPRVSPSRPAEEKSAASVIPPRPTRMTNPVPQNSRRDAIDRSAAPARLETVTPKEPRTTALPSESRVGTDRPDPSALGGPRVESASGKTAPATKTSAEALASDSPLIAAETRVSAIRQLEDVRPEPLPRVLEEGAPAGSRVEPLTPSEARMGENSAGTKGFSTLKADVGSVKPPDVRTGTAIPAHVEVKAEITSAEKISTELHGTGSRLTSMHTAESGWPIPTNIATDFSAGGSKAADIEGILNPRLMEEAETTVSRGPLSGTLDGTKVSPTPRAGETERTQLADGVSSSETPFNGVSPAGQVRGVPAQGRGAEGSSTNSQDAPWNTFKAQNGREALYSGLKEGINVVLGNFMNDGVVQQITGQRLSSSEWAFELLGGPLVMARHGMYKWSFTGERWAYRNQPENGLIVHRWLSEIPISWSYYAMYMITKDAVKNGIFGVPVVTELNPSTPLPESAR